MLMRPQTQIASAALATAAQLVAISDLELLQHLARIQRHKLGVSGAEGFGNGFVFLRQDGAGGIDQTATGLDQARAAFQDGCLFLRQLLLSLGPLLST